MVNLLKFRADGGQASYVGYFREAADHFARIGGRFIYAGRSPAVMIEEGENPWWDAILVVEYPTPAAFLDMVTDESFGKVSVNRENALDRGDLVVTSSWTTADYASMHRCDRVGGRSVK